MPLAFSVEGRLGLDIANFKTKMEQASKDLNSFKARTKKTVMAVKKGFKAVTSAVSKLSGVFSILSAASVAGFTAMTKGALDAAREIEDLAVTTGSSVKEVQGLTLAFANFGLEADDVGDVLNTIADRSKDAEDGMQSFIDDFKLVGIEVEDLKGKRPAELFDTFADAVSRTEDPVKRQAAIVRILGDDLGRKLSPALLEGSESFRELIVEAEKSGAIMSAGVVKAAAETSRRMKGLSTLMKAGVNRAFAELAPFIQLVSERLKSFLDLGGQSQFTIIPALKNTIMFFGELGDAITRVKQVVQGAAVVWDAFKVGLITAVNAMLRGIEIFAQGIIDGVLFPVKKALQLVSKFSDDAKNALAGLRNFKVEVPKIPTELLNNQLQELTMSVETFKKSLDEPLPSDVAKDFIEELDVLTAKLEETATVAERLRLEGSGEALGKSSTDGLAEGAQANLEQFEKSVQKTLGSELEQVLQGNFDNIGDAFKSLLIKMAADALAADIGRFLGFTQPAAAPGAGAGGGAGFFAGAAQFLGGFFANGGNPPIGRPSVVGERGPELFVPRTAGTVVPNEAMDGGQTVVNNFNITTNDAESFRSARGRIAAQFATGIGQ